MNNTKHQKDTAIVVPGNDLGRALDAAGAAPDGSGVTVWNLGSHLEAVPQGTGTTFGQIGSRLDDAADRAEAELINLDRQLLAHEDDRLAWDVSLVSDTSPYVTDLQLNVARLMVMCDVLQSGGRHIFLVDDKKSGHALAKAVRANGHSARWTGGGYSPTLGWAGLLRAPASAAWRRLLHRFEMARARKGQSANWKALSKCDVLVLDWAEPGSFKTDGQTRNSRNLRRVPGVLADSGMKVGFIANPISWLHPFADIAENVAAAESPVVMVDECFSLGSLLGGIRKILRMRSRLNRTIVVQGLNVSALLDVIKEEDRLSSRPFRAFSFSEIGRALAKRGVRPKAIVYPYENQGWERALRAGVRTHLPETRMVAYQYAPFAARYLSFYPPASDVRENRLADHMVFSGKYFTDLLTGHGFPEERTSVGGAMQFEKLMEAGENRPQSASSYKTVLCTTSIDLSESLSMACRCARVVSGIENIRIIFSFHPVVHDEDKARIRSTVSKQFPQTADKIEFSTQPTRDLLDRADAIIYGTSGTVFESLLRGIPSIFIAEEGAVSQNKLPKGIALAYRAFNDVTLRELLVNIANDTPLPDTNGGTMKLGACLAPVDDAVFVSAVMGTEGK